MERAGAISRRDEGLAIAEAIHQAAQIFALGLGPVRILGAAADFIVDFARPRRVRCVRHEAWTVAIAACATPKRIAAAACAFVTALPSAVAHLGAQGFRAFA